MNTKRRFALGVLLFVVGFSTSLWAQSAKALAQKMKEAKDDRTLMSLRDDLGKMNKEGAGALDSVLADTSAAAKVRVNAALGLVKMAEESGGAFGTAELAKYTKDNNGTVRYLALKGLVNPATRYDKAPSLLAEAIKDPAMPIREMAIKYIAERKDNARLLAEDIVNAKEQREVKEQAERVFKEITGEDYRFTEAVKRDPNNPKVAIPDPDKEKAAIAQYEEWLKKSK